MQGTAISILYGATAVKSTLVSIGGELSSGSGDVAFTHYIRYTTCSWCYKR